MDPICRTRAVLMPSKIVFRIAERSFFPVSFLPGLKQLTMLTNFEQLISEERVS